MLIEMVFAERDKLFGYTNENSPRWRSEEQGLQRFCGKPCKKCGDTIKFTNINKAGHHTGECMTCRAESKARRRAAKLQRTPPWFNEGHKQQIREMIMERDRLTKETGIKHHLDHIIPLQGKNVSGLHVPWNLQILTESENCSKSNFFGN